MIPFKFLGTFSTPDSIDIASDKIKESYNDVARIFVLDIGCVDYLLTYNTTEFNVKSTTLQTIILNRKKLTNTIYTINAINTMTKGQNNYSVNWTEYQNKILLIRNNMPYVADTKIFKIINIKTI